jgi:hypothetical protein
VQGWYQEDGGKWLISQKLAQTLPSLLPAGYNSACLGSVSDSVVKRFACSRQVRKGEANKHLPARAGATVAQSGVEHRLEYRMGPVCSEAAGLCGYAGCRVQQVKASLSPYIPVLVRHRLFLCLELCDV